MCISRHVGLASHCKRQPGSRTRCFQPDCCVRIVGGENGHTLQIQSFNHRTIFMGHGLNCTHELKVFTLGIVDQGYRRPGDVGKIGNLTRMVHAQLNDTNGVVGSQTQKR